MHLAIPTHLNLIKVDDSNRIGSPSVPTRSTATPLMTLPIPLLILRRHSLNLGCSLRLLLLIFLLLPQHLCVELRTLLLSPIHAWHPLSVGHSVHVATGCGVHGALHQSLPLGTLRYGVGNHSHDLFLSCVGVFLANRFFHAESLRNHTIAKLLRMAHSRRSRLALGR